MESPYWLANVQYFEQNLYIPDLQISDLVKIVKTLKSAPKPRLIHCRAGADRTGMAVALYHYAIEKKTMDQAIAHSLTFAFGHLGRWNTPRIYEVLREYEQQFPNE